MPTIFPANPLGLKLEMLLNSVWTDVSAYMYQRDNATITSVGRADESSAIQPAQLTVTLNNTGGRFTPKNTAGAYYPYIGRNVQIRLSVNSESSTLVAYSGYRFWGEVTEWPPLWDVTGKDVTCTIVASGIWRRISRSTLTIGSPFRRYYMNLTGGSVPQGYWPMEDGNGSLAFVNYLPGGASGTNGTWAGTPGPSLAQTSTFTGSDAIPQLNASAITLTVAAGGTTTSNCIRFLLSVPLAGDSASGTTNWNLVEVDTAGTITKLEVYLNYTGTLTIDGKNSGGTVVFTGTTTNKYLGVPVLVSLELTTTTWTLNTIKPGAGSIFETKTGSLSMTIGAVSKVIFGRANALNETAVGHCAVIYTIPSLTTAAYPLSGYIGEYALDRFTRLCTELGIASETIGTSATTAALGPQVDQTMSQVFQAIEDADCGLLYESRSALALGYRSKASMQSQAVALTLNYGTSVLASQIQVTYDDQLTRNDVTITNYDGFAIDAVLIAGAMSIQAPPSGVGQGYQYARNVALAADSQVTGVASWVLGVGSVDEPRYPILTLDMSRSAVASLFATIPGMRIGDYLQITNPPAFLTASAVNQLVWGIEETLNNYIWTITFNCVPESPWATGYNPGTVSAKQVSGSAATNPTSSSSATLATLMGNYGPLGWPALTSTISYTAPGGTLVVVGFTAPSNPQTGALWFNANSGLALEVWNGSTWVTYAYGLSQAADNAVISALIATGAVTSTGIQNGTITPAQIATDAAALGASLANGTLTTTQIINYMAAETQVAGGYATAISLGGQVIKGTFFIAGYWTGAGTQDWQNATPSTPGYFMYYDTGSGTPQLVFSATAGPGSDQWGNSWQGGTTFVGLAGTLPNVLSVTDTGGDTLAKIDSSGNITGAALSTSSDLYIGGYSTLAALTAPAQGLLAFGQMTVPFPSSGTFSGSQQALFELDQAVIAGRVYRVRVSGGIVDCTGLGGASAPVRLFMDLRYTSDGTTPSTSSSEIAQGSTEISAANQDAPTPPLEWVFAPGSNTTYRFLVCGYITSSATATWKFQDTPIYMTIEDLGVNNAGNTANNLLTLGSGGTGGGSGKQVYTEDFYPANTYSYYSNSGLRNTNGNMFHGAYSGESPNYQYSYIQWSTGSLGNNLNTVLGYTVNYVHLRLTNLHSWYDNGMTYGIHSSTSLGSTTWSTILNTGGSFISEGNTYTFTLGPSQWAPWAAGGTTYMVLAPDSGDLTNLSWYGYFYGGGGSTSYMPKLTVNYTH
jgi:hypothetical protein